MEQEKNSEHLPDWWPPIRLFCAINYLALHIALLRSVGADDFGRAPRRRRCRALLALRLELLYRLASKRVTVEEQPIHWPRTLD